MSAESFWNVMSIYSSAMRDNGDEAAAKKIMKIRISVSIVLSIRLLLPSTCHFFFSFIHSLALLLCFFFNFSDALTPRKFFHRHNNCNDMPIDVSSVELFRSGVKKEIHGFHFGLCAVFGSEKLIELAYISIRVLCCPIWINEYDYHCIRCDDDMIDAFDHRIQFEIFSLSSLVQQQVHRRGDINN